MNWKKYVSVGLTALLIAGVSSPFQSAHIVSANSDAGVALESSNDSSSSSSESSTGGESSSESSGGSSDSGSSGESGSGSSSESSGGSSESESGGDSSSESGGSESSSDSTEKDSSESSSTSGKDVNTEASSTEGEKTTEAPKKKTVVEDDSNGRDYNASEIVSSGNTYFTIVPVSRDGEKIDKKIAELEQKRTALRLKKKLLLAQVADAKKYVADVQSIFTYVDQGMQGVDYNLALLGCLRDGSDQSENPNLEGIDSMLRNLAKKYDNDSLRQWTEQYSIESLPKSVEISTMEDMFQVYGEPIPEEDKKSEEATTEAKAIPQEKPLLEVTEEHILSDDTMYSSPVLILQSMLEEAKAEEQALSAKVEETREELKDIREHIENLKKKKEENTYDLDSRLVEYKDIIPEQAVTFLNAAVAKEGCPYVWGADGPNAFDCSGLVSYALRQTGAVSSGFRWTSHDFAGQLTSIPFSDAKPGDLAWKPGHIAIYIDAGTVFEAPYTGALVRFTSCDVSGRFSRILRWWNPND